MVLRWLAVRAMLAMGVLTAPAWAQADNCDAVREQIEGKIRAAGVAGFAVTVVDAAASAPGKVVGQCAQGRRKIVYQRADAAAPPPIVTECKDGSVPVDGNCKK